LKLIKNVRLNSGTFHPGIRIDIIIYWKIQRFSRTNIREWAQVTATFVETNNPLIQDHGKGLIDKEIVTIIHSLW